MFWILPINLPVLVVWIRNLTVHWLTPFSAQHNILSILPMVLLVETLSAGHMIPRVRSVYRALTNVLLFGMAAYTAMCGVTYAFVLHHLANVVCAWLVLIHFDVKVDEELDKVRAWVGKMRGHGGGGGRKMVEKQG